ncbi:hypothetical protein QJQ45_028674, partial [Haematococcus lacustris]
SHNIARVRTAQSSHLTMARLPTLTVCLIAAIIALTCGYQMTHKPARPPCLILAGVDARKLINNDAAAARKLVEESSSIDYPQVYSSPWAFLTSEANLSRVAAVIESVGLQPFFANESATGYTILAPTNQVSKAEYVVPHPESQPRQRLATAKSSWFWAASVHLHLTGECSCWQAFEELDALNLEVDPLTAIEYHALNHTYSTAVLPVNEVVVDGTRTNYKIFAKDAEGTVYVADQLGVVATVIAADIPTNGSFVQVIDKVLLPLVPDNILAAAQLPMYANHTKTFVETVTASSFQPLLYDPSLDVTVLVPGDNVFAYFVEEGWLQEDDSRQPRLDCIIAAHTLAGGWFTTDWANGTVLDTLYPGASLLVVKEGLEVRLVGQGSLSGNTALVTIGNILGNPAGAKVHAILSVLVPDMPRFASPAALTTSPQHGEQLSSLAQLLSDTELWDLFSSAEALSNYTLFAPTNEAFAEAAALGLDVELASNLQYHSLEGLYTIYSLPAYTPVVVGTATQYKTFYRVDYDAYVVDMIGRVAHVVVPNLDTNGSVTHIIDKVLLNYQPSNFAELTSWMPNATSMVAEYIGASSFASGATDSSVNITLLAPSNDVFQYYIDAGLLTEADMLQPRLDSIIACHMIDGGQFVTEWASGSVIQTLNPTASLLVYSDGHTTTLVGQGSIAGQTATFSAINLLATPAGAKLNLITSVFLPAQAEESSEGSSEVSA